MNINSVMIEYDTTDFYWNRTYHCMVANAVMLGWASDYRPERFVVRSEQTGRVVTFSRFDNDWGNTAAVMYRAEDEDLGGIEAHIYA